MNTNQVNQISIDNWTFKLFYKVNLLTNAFMLMKFITASFSYSHLHLVFEWFIQRLEQL